MASPAPTRRATPPDFNIPASRTSDLIRGRAYGFVRNHRVDGTVTVTEFTQYDAGVLTYPWCRAADDGLADLEDGRRLRLPHPAHRRLVELLDQAACHDLLVMDNLAATQDRRARHIGGIQPLQPLGGGALADVFLHLVDARGGVDKACPRCGEPLVPGQFRIARRLAEALPFGVRDRAAGDIAVARLEHEVRTVVGIHGRGFGADHRVLHHAFRPQIRDHGVQHRDVDVIALPG